MPNFCVPMANILISNTIEDRDRHESCRKNLQAFSIKTSGCIEKPAGST
jgi:hypothetical protein